MIATRAALCIAAVWSLLMIAVARGDDDLQALSGGMVRIDWGDCAPVDQGDTSGCGPVSLLNMLKLGPPSFHQAFTQLCSEQDSQALTRLADKYCAAGGAGGKIAYSHESGINDANLSRLCNAVAADFQLGPITTLYTNRLEDESNGDFTQRINTRLLHSVRAGVPVVISIDSYAVRDQEWDKLTGHYVLLTGVQPVGAANAESFLIEYVDPVGARQRQAFVYGSSRRNSRALAHFPDGDRWLEDNPYLYVTAPALNLSESRQEEGARHAYFLTIVFGRLE